MDRAGFWLSLYIVLALATAHAGGGVTFEWAPLENAKKYEIEIGTNRYTTKEPSWTGAVKPGPYSVRVRSFDKAGTAGPWSDKQQVSVRFASPELIRLTSKMEIRTGRDRTAAVKFLWDSKAGIREYKLTITSQGIKPIELMVPEAETSVELPVARSYAWKVAPVAYNGGIGEAIREQTFVLIGSKIKPPVIPEPKTVFVREIAWSRPEFAESFDYTLFRKENIGTPAEKWLPLRSQTGFKGVKIVLDEKVPGGLYRLTIRAQAEWRIPSDTATIEFNVQAGDRSPAALEQAQIIESLEKTKNWYGIASYFITSMDYVSANYDTGNSVAFSALGGTGRVGAGYIYQDKPWGVFGIVDLSGFTLNGETQKFAAAEAHGVWRKFFDDSPLGTTQLKVSGGLGYKELPEMIGKGENRYESSRISILNLHGGAEWWKPISPLLGVQVNARIYLNLFGLQTPNGNSASPSVSYQFGVLGSRKLSKTISGYAGYSYRVDKASYAAKPATDSPASAGDINTIQVSGHYLNFALEF